MYFTSLPDHSQPGFDEKEHFNRFRLHNIVFNAVATKPHDVRHVGCLSIKTIVAGEEWYGVDRRQLAVRPGQFLILNNDQDYTCRVDTAGEVRSQSVFFKSDFASAVLHDAVSREEALLDNPFGEGGQPLEFFQTLYTMDANLQQQLKRLIISLDTYGYDGDRVDEQLIFLLHHLIGRHKKEAGQASRINSIKPTTRREIYRRLCIARDLLHSSYMHNPDLAVISRTACLSTPQLVRQFKAVFRTTPHQYLMQLRLTHAGMLLKDTAMQVQDIAWQCGFENASAFCRAFRMEYGLSPLGYRSR